MRGVGIGKALGERNVLSSESREGGSGVCVDKVFAEGFDDEEVEVGEVREGRRRDRGFWTRGRELERDEGSVGWEGKAEGEGLVEFLVGEGWKCGVCGEVEEEERGEREEGEGAVFEREGQWEFVRETVHEDTGEGNENDGRENQESEPDVEVECLRSHEHMPKTGTEHVLKHIPECGVHDTKHHEIGKVDEQQEKTQPDVGPEQSTESLQKNTHGDQQSGLQKSFQKPMHPEKQRGLDGVKTE